MASTKSRSGGLLPINPAVTKKGSPNANQSKSTPKLPSPRLRLIIRQLPPGLTEVEFWTALGNEWRVGEGRVEWAAFKDGKVSKDPAKPSRPARAYLKVKEQTLLEGLSQKVKSTSFQDVKNTTKDLCLLGPPSLEFAPYNKVPSHRIRHDGRQGTIDQDKEFIDFLQSLTEPITKATANTSELNDTKPEKVTTTPLVQFIKDKKANKAKEPSQSKTGKSKAEAKAAKLAKSETKATVVVKGTSATNDKSRTAKATQDAVRAANKAVTEIQTKKSQEKAEKKTQSKEPATSALPAKKERERERVNTAAAARLLQRDLGLAKASRGARSASSAASSGDQRKVETPATSASSKTAGKTIVESAQEPKPAATPNALPPSGPKNTSGTKTGQKAQKQSSQPSAGAKSAFLKHANPSQGVTEELLRETFEKFGTVTRCEIDKKKGLAYVDFEDTESLKKAMQASPVKIGNGQVVVLENKNPNSKRGGQNQTNAAQPKVQPTSSPASAVATSTPKTPASPALSAASTAQSTDAGTTATTTAPTAPRAASRGGTGGNRGNRGNFNSNAGRGNFAASNRGGGRGGFRGGRGNHGGNQSRGAKGTNNTNTTGKPDAVAAASSASGTNADKSGSGDAK